MWMALLPGAIRERLGRRPPDARSGRVAGLSKSAIRPASRAGWPEGSTFADEPVAPGSARNPELIVSTPQLRLGVEVKAPALSRTRLNARLARYRPAAGSFLARP